MRSYYPYPLTIHDLEDFCHPHPDHVFHRPLRWQDGLAACNGYMLIIANRGLWLESEHPEPAGEALERLQKITMPEMASFPDDSWISLRDHTGTLFTRPGEHPAWTDQHRPAISPVWSIKTVFMAKLSWLQMIARLPRAELCLHCLRADAPLPFRFTGGRGLLAPYPHTPGHMTPDYRFLNPRNESII